SPANFVPSVSTLTLAAGASDTFTVAPATGLAAGTYAANVIVRGPAIFGSTGTQKYAYFSFTVLPP
ncbi:MAG: hypothetical protein FWG50_11875, partial [Kiritimatiellaeota bacterium]|nr:hypothetical protein [Kiritimatiellota bacterium]